ncbi:hypothetical protein A2U01_0002146 [Trifolium medium]|uniref:Uncharacterized protein n=1 Tax=Trifolium medium TaxID=97028 RepID=A0A392M234_9FABA|nr:hypothetical protein [Trifolium medium]
MARTTAQQGGIRRRQQLMQHNGGSEWWIMQRLVRVKSEEVNNSWTMLDPKSEEGNNLRNNSVVEVTNHLDN